MTRTSRILVLAIVAIVVAGTVIVAHAAPAGPPLPRLVKVAGVLPGATGTATVRFAIYADQASEAPLWAEKQRVVVGEAGRFAVYLGASQPDGLPVDLFATGDARWLGVQAEGQAEQARVLLVSVPYALKAADAETVGGKPLSAFVLAGDTTGVGPDGLTYVDTRVLKQGLSGAGTLPQGAGTPGYIGMFTDTTNLGNSVIFQNGTSIGVGTITPAAAFHSVATAAPGAFFDVYSNALGALPLVFRAARGTPASPSAVQTDDILGGVAVRGYGATGFTAGRGQVMFKAAENWTDSANGTYLQFTTTPIGSASWVERIRVDPNGNVGIGTTTPAQTLSVAGVIESTTGGFRFPDGTTQASAVSLATNTFTGTQTVSGGNLALPATAGGTVGVLTLGGQSFLHAFGGATNTFVGGQAGGGFVTTGLQNTAVGSGALFANTEGVNNTASGSSALSSNTTGSDNTASGVSALASNTTGFSNTASGWSALFSNTTGNNNTASGWSALFSNTIGGSNTASGVNALVLNTTGSDNTATGSSALSSNITGGSNTATGVGALYSNTTGESNTASGRDALFSNSTGSHNTASGYLALYGNTTGIENTASGDFALYRNTIGIHNTASGVSALFGNTTGNENTASGWTALYSNTTGSSNIAIGVNAGSSLTTGDSNIDIGHVGVAAEANTIRLGTTGTHTRAFIAGIRGVTTAGAAVAVLVDADGQLGTISSSRRVKDDIADMSAASSALMRLRPVTFHYKADQGRSGRTLQYGLIAEEVAEVYPGLVARSADGQIETVLYQFLPSMLLNEYQKQQRAIEAQAVRFEAKANALQAENEALRAQLAAIADRLARLEKRQ